jgi:bacterioferritin
LICSSISFVVVNVATNIAEQLKKHAPQELAHALEVARQINYLGGDPTMKGKEA